MHEAQPRICWLKRSVIAAIVVVSLGSNLLSRPEQSIAESFKCSWRPKGLATQKERTERDTGGRVEGAAVPLELQLTAKKATYVLDLDGERPGDVRNRIKTLAAFEAENPGRAGEVGDRYPPAPKVSLLLVLRNTGEKPVSFLFSRREVLQSMGTIPLGRMVFGDGLFIDLEIQGPGAERIENEKVRPELPDAEGYRGIPLEGGKAVSWAVPELRFGPPYRNVEYQGSYLHHRNRLYWTRPGEYSIRAILHTAIEFPIKERTPIRVYSNWLKLKVIPKG